MKSNDGKPNVMQPGNRCNNSKVAKDEFKSVFEDEIKRWQAKCDASVQSL